MRVRAVLFRHKYIYLTYYYILEKIKLYCKTAGACTRKVLTDKRLTTIVLNLV